MNKPSHEQRKDHLEMEIITICTVPNRLRNYSQSLCMYDLGPLTAMNRAEGALPNLFPPPPDMNNSMICMKW